MQLLSYTSDISFQSIYLTPYVFYNGLRVAKFKRPRVLGDQKISEDNQELRPGCPPDYQIFCERISPIFFILTNLSSYLSLNNKKSSIRTSTTYM